MAQTQQQQQQKKQTSVGRVRERSSTFPMIPVDEAIGDVLRQAVPLEAATMKLADIPRGKCGYMRGVHVRILCLLCCGCFVFYVWRVCATLTTASFCDSWKFQEQTHVQNRLQLVVPFVRGRHAAPGEAEAMRLLQCSAVLRLQTHGS